MQLIDTHVHVNFDKFEPDLEAVASRWRESGVVHLIHSCCHPEEFVGIRAIAERFGEVSLSVGLHPLEAHRWTPKTESQIRDLARSDERVVAIGEMGLDFYKADNPQLQTLVFESQMQIALELKKPIIVHCRNASVQMVDLLRNFWKNHAGVPGVMHCWGGGPEETRWFLDLGFYISFSGIVTFKNATQIRESVAMVGSDRLLLETDCPFLAPVPKRGMRNEPAYVRYVAAQVASIRGVTVEEIALCTTQNACRLFGLSINKNDSLRVS